MNGMEGKICYGVLGVQRRFETKAQAIVYAKLLKLPYSSVYLILPQAMKALELAQSLFLESISRRKRLTELELNKAISRIEKCSVQAADLDVRVHQYEHSEV